MADAVQSPSIVEDELVKRLRLFARSGVSDITGAEYKDACDRAAARITSDTARIERLEATLRVIAKEADEPRKFWSKRIGDIARITLQDKDSPHAN